jgi:hypothetical protein
VLEVVVDVEETRPNHRVAGVSVQRPRHLLDAGRRVHHVDQQLGRDVTDAKEHPLLVGGVVVEDPKRVRGAGPVLVDPPHERPVVNDADGGRELGVRRDRLAAASPQPVQQGIDLGRLLLPGLDEKGNRRRQVVVGAEEGQQLETFRPLGFLQLLHQPQGEGRLAEEILVPGVGPGDHLVELLLEPGRRRLEVAGLLQCRQGSFDAAENVVGEGGRLRCSGRGAARDQGQESGGGQPLAPCAHRFPRFVGAGRLPRPAGPGVSPAAPGRPCRAPARAR